MEFVKNQEHIVGKSLKALKALLCNFKKIKLKPKLLCQLFDSFVGSILGYGSEIWGFDKYKEAERLHLNFLRRILRVKVNTCSSCVYYDLGRNSIYKIYAHYKYWCKVPNSDNIKVKYVYTQCVIDCERGYNNWAASVKHILNSYGLGYAFYILDQVNAKSFPIIF